jgi:hypothetical protein
MAVSFKTTATATAEWRDVPGAPEGEERVEIVLIDTFIAPEDSKARFMDEVRRSAAFLRTRPGFVEGLV